MSDSQEDLPLKAAEGALREMNQGEQRRERPAPPELPAPTPQASEEIQALPLASHASTGASIDPPPAKVGVAFDPAEVQRQAVQMAELAVQSQELERSSVQAATLPPETDVGVTPFNAPESPASGVLPAVLPSAIPTQPAQDQPAGTPTTGYPPFDLGVTTGAPPPSNSYGAEDIKQTPSAPIAWGTPPELAPRNEGLGGEDSTLDLLRQILETLQGRESAGGAQDGMSDFGFFKVAEPGKQYPGLDLSDYADPPSPEEGLEQNTHVMTSDADGPKHQPSPMPSQGFNAGVPDVPEQQGYENSGADPAETLRQFSQQTGQAQQQSLAVLNQMTAVLQQLVTQMNGVYQRINQVQEQVKSLQTAANSDYENFQQGDYQ